MGKNQSNYPLWSRPVWGLAFLLCASFSHGAPEIDITAQVDRAAVTVGDPVRYEITVAHPVGARVDLPSVRGNTGRLEVLGYVVRTDPVDASRMSVTHTLSLAAWATGTDTLPPQRVEVRMPPDTAATVLYTPPTVITVEATVPAEAKDIVEIHDDERLPRGFPWGLPLVVLLIAAGVWLYRRYRRWKRLRALKPAQVIPARIVTPDEAALARLSDLERTVPSLSTRGRASSHAFAFAFSEILREYLAGRFGIDALEATTAELLERVALLPLGSERHDWIRAVSEELDAVKFATGTLTPADAARVIADARTFIHATAVNAPAPATLAAPADAAQGGNGIPSPDTGKTT